MTERNQSRWAAAVHESGHAVVAAALGRSVYEVRISANLGFDEDWVGVTSMDMPEDDDELVADEALRWPAAVIAHGGRFAEELVTGSQGGPGARDNDIERAHRYLPGSENLQAMEKAKGLLKVNRAALKQLAEVIERELHLRAPALAPLLAPVEPGSPGGG